MVVLVVKHPSVCEVEKPLSASFPVIPNDPLMSGAQTVYKSSEDRGLNTGGCPLWFGLRLFFGLLIGADNVWKKTGSQGTAVYIRAPRVHDGPSCLQIIRPLVSA